MRRVRQVSEQVTRGRRARGWFILTAALTLLFGVAYLKGRAE